MSGARNSQATAAATGGETTSTAGTHTDSLLTRRTAIAVFLAFALAYFFSAMLRAITATLAPTLTAEFALSAQQLGLLAGCYFLGFSLTQLPMGSWLDRYGPTKVMLSFLVIAVVGCMAFALATSYSQLVVARLLCGAGVGACLMAPLTGFRRWLAPAVQLRANSWMLMAGALGMVASTLPVQWLMPVSGWRALFWGLALCIGIAAALIAWKVPPWQAAPPDAGAGAASYAQVLRHPYFRKLSPLGFFNYGGMVAIQTLWAGPWMVKVAGYAPLEAARGLFIINVAMLCTFWSWGMLNPWLARKGITVERLIGHGMPLSLVLLAAIVAAGPAAGAVAWAAFCMSSTFVSLAQPAIAMKFSAAVAGRALSAYNLVIFAGVFVMQWGIGLLIDGFLAAGLPEVASFRCAMAVFLACNLISYGYFLLAKDNSAQ